MNSASLRIDRAIYRSPVAHLLAGQTETAVAYVRDQLWKAEARKDIAAQQYKMFTSNYKMFASNFPQEVSLNKTSG